MASAQDLKDYQSYLQKGYGVGGAAIWTPENPPPPGQESLFQANLSAWRRRAQEESQQASANPTPTQPASTPAPTAPQTPPAGTTAQGGTAIGGGGGGSLGGGSAMSGLSQAGGATEFGGAQNSLAQYLPQLVGAQSAGRQGIGQRVSPALAGLLQVRTY